MGLLSFFQRKSQPAAKPTTDVSVQQLRVRARRRLIGAAVLVGLGVIGFPLVFETQPRPIPVDLPIDIPRKEVSPALVIPPAAPASALAQSAVEPPSTSASTVDPHRLAAVVPQPQTLPQPSPVEAPKPEKPMVKAVEKSAEPKVEKTREKATEKPAPRVVEKSADKASSKPAEKSADKPADKPKSAATSNAQEASRAQALLEGKPVAPAVSAAGGKFVVQVGAYADGKAAHEARMKLERMGIKTYLQTVETSAGQRIRVRAGPFTSREEADKVAGKVRGSGLSTAVLSL